MMFWSVWRRDFPMRWRHSTGSTLAILVRHCFLARGWMITDSKMLMQDVRSQMKVT